jgi:hypothetical protein
MYSLNHKKRKKKKYNKTIEHPVRITKYILTQIILMQDFPK